MIKIFTNLHHSVWASLINKHFKDNYGEDYHKEYIGWSESYFRRALQALKDPEDLRSLKYTEEELSKAKTYLDKNLEKVLEAKEKYGSTCRLDYSRQDYVAI